MSAIPRSSPLRSALTVLALIVAIGLFGVPEAASAAPVASFTASPNPVQVGQLVIADATASTDSSATITEFDWRAGDGATCFGCSPRVSHAFLSPGTYTFSLTVVDADGDSSTTSHQIVVTPAPQEQAQSGDVTAELFYDSHDFSKPIQVQITRGGQSPISETIRPTCSSGACYAAPANFYEHQSSLSVADLNGDREPEVRVDLSTGGNICCRYSVVYAYDASAATDRAIPMHWLNGGVIPVARDLDRDGLTEFIDSDGRFRYRFACGGCSDYPPVIWELAQSGFKDVTRSYPKVIARDAATEVRRYTSQRRIRHGARNVRGILAAYVADEYLLGQGQVGWRLVHEAEHRGDLVDYALGRPVPRDPRPATYVKQLRQFLRHLGYNRS